MKKLLLSVAALCCFVSAQAQWTNTTDIENTNAGSVRIKSRLLLGPSFGGIGTLEWFTSAWGAGYGHKFYNIDPSDGTGIVHLRLATRGGSTTWTDMVNFASNGNVGIGTNNPGTYRLAVEGRVGAREVVVTTAPWADYVFADSYKLRPLSEVARFIQENKHLPEVPTAAEIEKNGNSLAETDALLLKKIEELTLYVIEQNKQMQELKAENQTLRNEVNNLKK